MGKRVHRREVGGGRIDARLRFGFEIGGGLRIKDLAKKVVDACGSQWVKMGNRGEFCLFMVNKDIGR